MSDWSKLDGDLFHIATEDEREPSRAAPVPLEICQFGLDLKPGDEILTTNQDIPRMLAAWDQRERRDGIIDERRF